MADFMRLKDGTEFDIEEGASLGEIVHIATSNENGIIVSNAVTKDNVAHVEFFSTNEYQEANEEEPSIYGIYDDLIVNSVYFDTQNMKVLISLREQSPLEARVEELEEALELTNEALDYIIMGEE